MDFPMDFWLFWMCFIDVLFKFITNLKFYKLFFYQRWTSEAFCIIGWCIVRDSTAGKVLRLSPKLSLWFQYQEAETSFIIVTCKQMMKNLQILETLVGLTRYLYKMLQDIETAQHSRYTPQGVQVRVQCRHLHFLNLSSVYSRYMLRGCCHLLAYTTMHLLKVTFTAPTDTCRPLTCICRPFHLQAPAPTGPCTFWTCRPLHLLHLQHLQAPAPSAPAGPSTSCTCRPLHLLHLPASASPAPGCLSTSCTCRPLHLLHLTASAPHVPPAPAGPSTSCTCRPQYLQHLPVPAPAPEDTYSLCFS